MYINTGYGLVKSDIQSKGMLGARSYRKIISRIFTRVDLFFAGFEVSPYGLHPKLETAADSLRCLSRNAKHREGRISMACVFVNY